MSLEKNRKIEIKTPREIEEQDLEKTEDKETFKELGRMVEFMYLIRQGAARVDVETDKENKPLSLKIYRPVNNELLFSSDNPRVIEEYSRLMFKRE